MTKLTMTAKAADKSAYNFITETCRKISSNDDEKSGFQIYVGKAPATSFLKLPDSENVREYIVGSGEIERRSSVHIAIKDTLETKPELFSVLNGGICIVAKSLKLDSDNKTIILENPSIINGSQTRGVVKDYLESFDVTTSAQIKYEIIVTNDDNLISDISIARNFQITVKLLSILGKKGYLSDISKRFIDHSGKKRVISVSETDRGEGFIPTEKLIQVISSLIPEELWNVTGKNKNEHSNKVFAYSGATGPLKLFQKVYDEAKQGDQDNKKLYDFYVQIASDAWRLYENWKCHQGFKGTGWKIGIKRDDKGNIIEIVDGITFPIISAFSNFVCRKNDNWTIDIPSFWNDQSIISAAKGQFQSAADHNPQSMGKSSSCYNALYQLTLITKQFASANVA